MESYHVYTRCVTNKIMKKKKKLLKKLMENFIKFKVKIGKCMDYSYVYPLGFAPNLTYFQIYIENNESRYLTKGKVNNLL